LKHLLKVVFQVLEVAKCDGLIRNV